MDRNCWEVEGLPCCRRNNKDRCEDCVIYLIEINKLGRMGVMCLKVKKCDDYSICDVYKANQNCWEVEGVLCCKSDKVACGSCYVYLCSLNRALMNEESRK
jgi:hypothetical protein